MFLTNDSTQWISHRVVPTPRYAGSSINYLDQVFFFIIPIFFLILVVTLFSNYHWTEQLLVSTLWFDVCLLNRMRGAWAARKSGNRLTWLISLQKKIHTSLSLPSIYANPSSAFLTLLSALAALSVCHSALNLKQETTIAYHNNLSPTKGKRIHNQDCISKSCVFTGQELKKLFNVILQDYPVISYEELEQEMSGFVLSLIIFSSKIHILLLLLS